jgi:hypothetical protein
MVAYVRRLLLLSDSKKSAWNDTYSTLMEKEID